MKASDFDKAFDNGDDIDHLIDWASGTRPNLLRRLEFELPTWMAEGLDRQAHELGLTSQALLQRWISEKLS